MQMPSPTPDQLSQNPGAWREQSHCFQTSRVGYDGRQVLKMTAQRGFEIGGSVCKPQLWYYQLRTLRKPINSLTSPFPPVMQHKWSWPLCGALRMKARYICHVTLGQCHYYSKIHSIHILLEVKDLVLKWVNRPVLRGPETTHLCFLLWSGLKSSDLLLEHKGEGCWFWLHRGALWARGWNSEHPSPAWMQSFARILNRMGLR